MMRKNYQFSGRGSKVESDNACHSIECAEGRVLAITEVFGNAEFVIGYCRAAIIDQWGVCCIDAFRRVSNDDLTRTWAEPKKAGLVIFRGVRLRLVGEEAWMLRSA